MRFHVQTREFRVLANAHEDSTFCVRFTFSYHRIHVFIHRKRLKLHSESRGSCVLVRFTSGKEKFVDDRLVKRNDNMVSDVRNVITQYVSL